MLIKRPDDIASSEITPERVYLDRRRFMGVLAAGATAAALDPELLVGAEPMPAGAGTGPGGAATRPGGAATPRRAMARRSRERQDEPTSFEAITTYNNFYEFGLGKEDPSRHAGRLKTRPWSIAVEGHVAKPAVYDLEDFLEPYEMQDRVYRMRCVEGWSMVIPWRGFPLAELIRRVEPTSQAKYVEFETLLDPEQMPMQNTNVLDWPYVEGLRMDEALHPLTLLSTGLYGRDLPNQNGAPIRLVVPWKYGFKSIKSIVRIRFVEEQPVSTWMRAASNEYGFYANVNPNVDHPRWSQRTERRIGEFRRRETLLFNGYASQVAPLYEGMDLVKNF